MANRNLKFAGLTLIMGMCLVPRCSAAESSCDCGIGRVGMFEFDVQVPRPTGDANAILRYKWLFYMAKETIIKIRADQSCPRLVYIDGNVWLPNGETRLLSGLETPTLPPPGRLDLDYIVTGQVTGSAGVYTVVARIESGYSREVVKTASYALKDPGKGNMLPDYDAAVASLAGQLSPLGGVITQWEKRKRDADPGIARSQPEGTLTIRPAKSQLDEGETTDVELELADCDGVKLKNRTVHLLSGQWETLGSLEGTTGGKVQPSVVVTDDEGKAHVKFTAGNQRGPAYIRAWYGHHRPGGQPNAIIGKATVNIGAPNLCFSVAVDLKMQMPDTPQIYENHHVETIYKVAGFDEKTGCPFASLKPGETWGLVEASIRGTATGHRETGTSASSSIDRPGDLTVATARFVRAAQGGTFTFLIRQVPAGDAEEYVGNCAAQRWEPWPYQFKLSEDELHHPDKLHKSLALNLPLGENSCTGTGTAVLTGHP
jgi:hypothetical protein